VYSSQGHLSRLARAKARMEVYDALRVSVIISIRGFGDYAAHVTHVCALRRFVVNRTHS
jgi:hypothetical protein